MCARARLRSRLIRDTSAGTIGHSLFLSLRLVVVAFALPLSRFFFLLKIVRRLYLYAWGRLRLEGIQKKTKKKN